MMRESDRRTIAHFVSGRKLMYRAGKAVFDILRDLLRSDFGPNPKVAVVCGSGNNAGDGYVVAGLLCDHGIDCTVIRTSNQCSEDGRYYFEQCVEKGVKIHFFSCPEPLDAAASASVQSESDRSGPDIAGADLSISDVPERDLSGFDIVVDALLGTGFRAAPREETMRVIRAINRSRAFVVSIDINSALNGDSGMTNDFDVPTNDCGTPTSDCGTPTSEDDYRCVRSDLTISIGEWKAGHFLGIAKDVMKEKANVDIGIIPLASSTALMEERDFRGIFRERKHISNKSSYGYLALIGGSVEYSGAIRLAAMANAAMRAGAGVVRLAAPSDICHALIPEILEATLFPLSFEEFEEEVAALIKNTKAVAFGMGVGTSAGAREMLAYLLRTYTGLLIVDADGLTLLSEMDEGVLRDRMCTLILTPHIKEMSRLLHCSVSEIRHAPIEKAKEMAKRLKNPFAENEDSADSAFGDRGLARLDFADIVLLKGPTTIVTDGEAVLLVDAGCPGMATAGSGDVLSGILAAICANHSQLDVSGIRLPQTSAVNSSDPSAEAFAFSPSRILLYATALAAWINGRAGELAQEEMGEIAMIASDTIRKIPEVLKLLGNRKKLLGNRKNKKD